MLIRNLSHSLWYAAAKKIKSSENFGTRNIRTGIDIRIVRLTRRRISNHIFRRPGSYGNYRAGVRKYRKSDTVAGSIITQHRPSDIARVAALPEFPGPVSIEKWQSSSG